MWSPKGKVWSPEMKNVESKILQSRSVMMMIGASLTFRSKGEVYTNVPPLLVPIFALCSSSLIFSKIFSLATLARLHEIAELRNSGMQLRGVLYRTSV